MSDETQGPLGPLEVIATTPHALRAQGVELHMTPEELKKYRETRAKGLVKVKGDSQPAWAVVKRLPPSYTPSLAPFDSATIYALAFKAAVHLIRMPDGTDLRPKPEQLSASRPGVEMAGDEWVDEIGNRFGMDFVIEVGRVAYEFARMPLDPAVRFPFSSWGG